MQTRFITSLSTTLNPFSLTSKTPRLFLSLLPPKFHNSVKVKIKQLPSTSTAPSELKIGFKDGKEMSWSWGTGAGSGKVEKGKGKEDEVVRLKDVVEEVERHSRGLGRKEDLAS